MSEVLASQVESLEIVSGGMHFDGVQAVSEVSFQLKRGQVFGLIGPNGSGKTTTLNLLSGLLRPSEGIIRLDGRDITRMSMRHRVHAGIVRTFQGVRVFERLTIRENIEAAVLGGGLSRAKAKATVNTILNELGLESTAETLAGATPAGLIRRVGIARALAANPRFLLLDEPAAGQNESEGVELVSTIRNLADHRNIGVLLVEHDMSVVMNTCDHLHVLDGGRTVAQGDPRQVRSDPTVIEVYFGSRK